MTISKIAISAVLLQSMAGGAHAASYFSDRASFIAQTTPQIYENFNDVAPGSSFAGQELTIGNMTFGGGISTEPSVFLNVIAPGGSCIGSNFDTFQSDGSRYACAYAGSHADLRIDFLAPVISWGADFGDLGDELRQTRISFFDTDSNLISDYIASGNQQAQGTFFGVDLDGAEAGHMTFSFLVGQSGGATYDAFGIDNVGFSTGRGQNMPSSVPLPASFFLLSGAGCFFAGLRRLKPGKSPRAA